MMIDGINQLPAPLFLPKGHYCSQHQSVCLLLSRTASQFPDVFLDCQQLGQACVELEQTELGVNAYKRFFLHVSQVLFFLTLSFLADYCIFLLPVLHIYIYYIEKHLARSHVSYFTTHATWGSRCSCRWKRTGSGGFDENGGVLQFGPQ